jgi:hypothetical protein
VQQTLCHGGELSILQRIIQEHTNVGNFAHAVAFGFSMFDLRVLDMPLEMVNVSEYNIAEAILPGIGRAALGWELRALVFGVLKEFSRGGTEVPVGVNLTDIVPKFSAGHLSLIRVFGGRFGIVVDDLLVQRMWHIIHFIHTVIVGPKGEFSPERIFELFEGKVDMDDELRLEETVILKAFRFSIAVLMLVSVGMAPTGNDEDELFRFMEETDETYQALPLRSNEVALALKSGLTSVLSMVCEQEVVSLVRLSKTTTNWSVFAMDSECIRGFWTNEARSILFLAMSSRERNSIQFSIQSLRNITNQSCNQPIGYPAYVTDIIDSYTEKE